MKRNLATVLIFLLLLALSIGARAGFNRFFPNAYHKIWGDNRAPVVVQAAPVKPVQEVKSESRDGPQVLPPVLTGVSRFRDVVLMQWSDGTVLSSVDLGLLGARWHVTATALYVAGHRFPLQDHPSSVRPGGAPAVPPVVAPALAPHADPVRDAPDDDPVWQWSGARGAWVVRDRSTLSGAR